MPSERLGLRSWLEKNLDSRKYQGVKWVEKSKGTFSIGWKHASRHGWDEDEDAALFKDWAIHTGRYHEHSDTPNPKTWKANFRCAMNASRDIKKVKDLTMIKGKNACRIFEFTKNRKSRVTVSQRSSNRKSEKEEVQYFMSKRRSRRCNLKRVESKCQKYVDCVFDGKTEEKEEDTKLECDVKPTTIQSAICVSKRRAKIPKESCLKMSLNNEVSKCKIEVNNSIVKYYFDLP